VVSKNPLDHPNTLDTLTVAQTYVAGQRVF